MSARLVAEARRYGNLVTALRAPAVEDCLPGLRGHPYEEAVDLAATTAVGLERALRHDVCPVSDLQVSDLDLLDVCCSHIASATRRLCPA